MNLNYNTYEKEFLLSTLLAFKIMISQVGINTANPSATLDLVSK